MENRGQDGQDGQDHSAEEAELVQMFANATSCDSNVVGGLARISQLKQKYSGPNLTNYMNMKKRAIFVWMSKFRKNESGKNDYPLSANLGEFADNAVRCVTIDASTFDLERDQEVKKKQAQKAIISRPTIHSLITTQECMASVRHLSMLEHQTQSKKQSVPLYPLWVVVKLVCNMKLRVIGNDAVRAATGRAEPTGTMSKVSAQPKKSSKASSKKRTNTASSGQKKETGSKRTKPAASSSAPKKRMASPGTSTASSATASPGHQKKQSGHQKKTGQQKKQTGSKSPKQASTR